jgi:hypothetical protein
MRGRQRQADAGGRRRKQADAGGRRRKQADAGQGREGADRKDYVSEKFQ